MNRPALPLLFLACGALAWAACDQHSDNAYLPTSPGIAEALSVTPSASTIPADGFSRVVITGQITAEADLDKRQIQFTTTGGVFIEPDSNNTKQKTGKVDTQGVLTVELRSDTMARVVTVTAMVFDTTDNNNPVAIDGLVVRTDIEFTPPSPPDVVRVGTSTSRGEADGVTQIFVHADVAPGLPIGAARDVVFTTTLGTIAGGTTAGGLSTKTERADGSHRATVTLVSPSTVGEARITAKVSDTTAETFVGFWAAQPDTVRVTLNQPKLTRGGTEMATATVTLARDPGRGTVTANTEVHYSAVEKDDGDHLELLFRNQMPSNASGVAMAEVHLGSVTLVGTATVRAKVGSVQGEEDIEIEAPPTGDPDIAVDKLNLDFGQVATGTSSDMTVTVSNTGPVPLNVMVPTITGDGFSLVDGPTGNVVIPAGSTVLILTVRFSPASTGMKMGTLMIPSDDPDENPVTVMLEGEGAVPDIDVGPNSLDYGTVQMGMLLDKTVTVGNTGPVTLRITALEIAPPMEGFTLVGPPALPVDISAGGSTLTISVRFSPPSTGDKTATLTITSNDPDETMVPVALMGTGAPP